MIDPSIQQYVKNASQKTGIPEEVIMAVVNQESRGNPKAVSPAGAQGAMQLMPATAKSLGVSDPFDPEQNIMGGANYLKQQVDNFKSLPMALAAYNAGPGNVKKYGDIPPFKETQGYVNKIMGGLNLDDLKQKYPNFTWGDSQPQAQNEVLSNGGVQPQPPQQDQTQDQTKSSVINEMLKAAGLDPESQKRQQRADMFSTVMSGLAASLAGLHKDNGKSQEEILQRMDARQQQRAEQRQGALAKLMDAYKTTIKPDTSTNDVKDYNYYVQQETAAGNPKPKSYYEWDMDRRRALQPLLDPNVTQLTGLITDQLKDKILKKQTQGSAVAPSGPTAPAGFRFVN